MLSRYDPVREALRLTRAMDQLLEQSMGSGLVAGGVVGVPLIAPMDVLETSDGYEVDVAIPGARPEDIDLTINQNTLTIRGQFGYQNERYESRAQQGEQKQQTDGRRWILRELPSGTFERTITFPRPVDPNTVRTSFANGILTIHLPVSEASRPRRISVAPSAQSLPSQVNVQGQSQQPQQAQQYQQPQQQYPPQQERPQGRQPQ